MISWLPWVCSLLMVLYTLRVFAWYYHWNKLTSSLPSYPETSGQLPHVTVLVAARNEENRIGPLLQLLQRQQYPAECLEIIVVDDHSTDNTAAVVSKFAGVSSVKLTSGYGKKAALTAGVKQATGSIVLCTDADCEPPTSWVAAMAKPFAMPKVKMVSGPVMLTRSNNHPAAVFDELETAALVAIGGAAIAAGSPSLCNGANIAYRREVFEAVNGYSGNQHIASGDDEFLMHKVAATWPGAVVFLPDKNAVVATPACGHWNQLLAQRRRWASKHRHYTRTGIKLELGLVFLANVSLPVLLASTTGCIWWLVPVGTKVGADAIFTQSAFRFFGKKLAWRWFLLFQLCYPFYLLGVGLAANAGTATWKGRRL